VVFQGRLKHNLTIIIS